MDVTNAVSIRLLASRSLNQLRCWLSYALSLFGVVRVRHLPTFVSVEPANFCQLRCPECPVGMWNKEQGTKNQDSSTTHQPRLMSLEVFGKTLQQVQASAHTMQFYFQGEPLLNKQLPEMITAAHNVGLYTIVSTNAQAITQPIAEALIKSGLNRIIVSIDGFSEESYTAYRVGGNLHKALEGLQHLANAKTKCHSRIRIELQVLRLRSNEHEWDWIKKNYKKLGATHLVFKTAQLYDFEHGHPLMPTDERYSRYKKTADGTYIHKKSSRLAPYCLFASSPCLRLWSGCVITTNGDVLPCCYDKDHRHAYGNIMQQSLAELYHSTKANALRRRVLLYLGEPLEMCKNCNK